MSENKDIQGKSTQVVGLKKSIHKSVLKDGEYHHLKNGTVSSFEGDVPFIQNMPSNLECVTLPEGYKVLNSDYIKERDYHVLFLVNPTFNKSEIGFFYGNECRYEAKLNQGCLNFNVAFPIKSQYKIKNCELHLYFQDEFNPDRHINLDDLPFKKQLVDGCYVDTDVFDCGSINIQNDLIPPVVKPNLPIEAGALFTGVYQFAVAYANITGNEQSSYYSKTNPLPIYEDRFSSYDNTEGSKANQLTDKAIPLEFSNLDIRYDYINLAVIKTVQGTPTYELIATLPISTTEYIYTGRETTKLLSIDRILGLYPDYYNSKTITSANNYLIRANMSTQDEANYQPFANLIELEWAVVRKKADTFESSYKNPITSVEYKGYQRGEVYPFAIHLLLTNGRKTSAFHIPGRKAKSSDLIKYTIDNIPSGESCNFFELVDNDPCSSTKLSELYHWQIYDTATIEEQKNPDELSVCDGDVIARGDFAYWESTDIYPCNSEVYQNLSGQKIRHHKFPTNNTIHHHNQPYTYSASGDSSAYQNDDTYIYPIGVQLKKSLETYIQTAINRGILSKEEADLIAGYEIVRGDRTGNKSIIAKGLLYNMNYYTDIEPSTGLSKKIHYPNYPFNDLREDKYLTGEISKDYEFIIFEVEVSGTTTYNSGYNIPYGVLGNPYPVTFILDRDVTVEESFTITYSVVGNPPIQGAFVASFKFFGEDRNTIEDFNIREGYISGESSNNFYEKDLFTFHSPDTTFKKPFIGQELNLHSVEFGASEGRFDQVKGHPEFKPAPLTSSANYTCAYKAVGNYNNYVSVPFTRRSIKDSSYLVANNFVKLPDTKGKINNRFRESSVGLKLSCEIENPSIEDESRYTISQNNQCNCRSVVEDRIMDNKNAFEVDSQCTTDNKWISSYYGSLKIKIPNQYGQLDTVKYVLTGSYHNVTDKPIPIFGGDTFITRFTLKRKNAFFNVNFIGQSPVGITYRGTKYANLLTPNYHADNEKGGILGEYVIDHSSSKLDCTQSSKSGIGSNNKNGFFYLFSTGVVNFFVESDINTELRYSGTTPETTWYPKLRNVDDVWDWMEEKTVPINLDNVYNYNFDYSKQNTEEALFVQAADFKPNSECKNTHPRRIIYSKQDNEEIAADNWLIYPANNYVDLDSYLGSIIDIKALDTYKVLVRCENGSLVFNAFDTLQLEQTSVTVGTGGMFSQRPQTFAETDTGYAGSQSKYAINTSQYGTFFPEFKRGRVFHYNNQLEEISNNGMFDWFQENMKFKIQVPNVNTDNPFTGIGYNSVYDNRLNLWFLTKKDYKLKNLKELGNITLDDNNNILYKNKPVNFLDTKIWKNVGWTISYSPLYKAWISFHSFQPNYYINGIENFYTGLQDQIIYKHWDKFSFQTYYKNLFPFEITITTAKEQLTSILQSIEYNLKVQKYLNNNYQDLYENHKINFNKAIISTDNQSSGLMNLIRKDNQNPYQSLRYPKPNTDSIDILYSKIEGHKYRINQFADLVLDKNNNVPIFLHDENGVDSVTNNIEYGKQYPQKLRNEFFDVTLINDTLSEYKFILKSLINKTLKSIR